MTGSTDIRSRLAEVTSAGGCSHPIRLFGETVNMATGELDQRVLKVPCKDRRAVVCPACSYLYKADAWILVASGLNGGKGVPESVALHRRLFITLTAPSFGAVHTDGARNGRCHPGRNLGSCSHGRPRGCARRHESGDLDLGSPLCLECHDYRGAVIWNAMASRLWNRTVTQVRRSVAKSHGLRERDLPKVARLSYLKVAEIQRRGLLHFHAILRVDGPDGPETGPPAWLTTELLAEHVRDAVGWIGVGVMGTSMAGHLLGAYSLLFILFVATLFISVLQLPVTRSTCTLARPPRSRVWLPKARSCASRPLRSLLRLTWSSPWLAFRPMFVR